MKHKDEFLKLISDCDDNNPEHIEMIEEYVKSNPEISTVWDITLDSVISSVELNKINVFSKLLELGFQSRAGTGDARLARFAVANNNIEMFLKILGDKAKDVINEPKLIYSHSLFMLAIYQKNMQPSFVKQLISLGGDINKTTPNGDSSLYWAARFNNYSAVEFLLNEGFDLLNKVGGELLTPITVAAKLTQGKFFLNYLNHLASNDAYGKLSPLGKLKLFEGLNYMQNKENIQLETLNFLKEYGDDRYDHHYFSKKINDFNSETKDVTKQLVSKLIESDFQGLLVNNQHNLVREILNQSKLWTENNSDDKDCQVLVEIMKSKIENFIGTELGEFTKNIKPHIAEYLHHKDSDNLLFNLPKEIFAKIFYDVLFSNSLLRDNKAIEGPLLCAGKKLEELASLNEFVKNFEDEVKTEVTGETL